jgi:hypothetical protein
MVCALCHKDIGERERFTLLEGVPYHDQCFDRSLSAQEPADKGRPSPER